MEDLEGHCDCGCDGSCGGYYPTPGVVLKSRREINIELDRAMLHVSNGFAESFKDYFSSFAIKARVRLAAAYVEDKFPRVYSLLTKIGVPKPY